MINICILRDEKLNWSKILKWTNSRIHPKIKKRKTYLTLNLNKTDFEWF